MKKFIIIAFLLLFTSACFAGYEGEDYSQIVKNCIASSEKITSYGSTFYLKDFGNKKLKRKNYATVEWRIIYEKPDKFSVEQYAWAQNVADKWLSIGKTHYFMIGGWFEEPAGKKEESHRDTTNEFLTLNKYLDILKNNPIESAKIVKKNGKEFIVLKYKLSESIFSKFVELEGDLQNEAELWIDKSSNLITTAFVRFSGIGKDGKKIDGGYEQIFIDYNKKFNIEKPKEVLNLN